MMRTFFRSYAPSVGILFVLLVDSLLLSPGYLHPQKWMIWLFFFFLYSITEKINFFGLKETPQKFQIYFFSAMIIRMILSIIFIFIFLYLQVENLFLFVGTFFLFYFYYIVFDIYHLLGNLRAD